jgi:hypothetical protein
MTQLDVLAAPRPTSVAHLPRCHPQAIVARCILGLLEHPDGPCGSGLTQRHNPPEEML